jgi:hypothetical protein
MEHKKSKVESGNKQDPKAGLSVPVEDGEIDNEHLNDNQAQKDQQSEDTPKAVSMPASSNEIWEGDIL